MDDSLDLQTTYRAILAAAREGKYVTYGTLAAANGAKWAKVRYKLNDQLGEIMKLAAERDWPIPSAIVVDQANLETGRLSDSATKGFVGAAKELGFDVQDPQAFIAEQQQAMFAWAEGAPDELGLGGGVAEVLFDDPDRSFWFVGAFWDNDQTERFVNEGIWQNGYETKFAELVGRMKPGDRVAIKATFTKKHGLPFEYRGKPESCMRIKAIGTVTERTSDGRTVRVDWTPLEEPKEWYFHTYWKTIVEADASDEAARRLIQFAFGDHSQDYGFWLAKPHLHRPLNTILYGPPGTGKTYTTFQRCVDICDSTVAGKTPEAIHERYRELVEEGRVEFVTFHQSYGYEEFVEGLRPESVGHGGGFRLEVRDGVLKRIAKRARVTQAPHPMKRRFVKMQLSGQGVFEECIKDGCVRFGPTEDWSDEDWSDAGYSTYDACLNRFEERWGRGAKRWWNATSAATFRAWANRGDIVVVPDGFSKSSYRAVGEIVGDYEYSRQSSSPFWSHRRAVRWHWQANGDPRPVDEFQDKSFGGQLIHELRPDRPDILLQHLQQDQQRQPYVLVIDEINRANIAKVLGELITLLEEDKREGAENELAVTLPHSNERFTLPANLYVLGTMNTADRSIALLDTALRRRFVFEEITPDPALLEKAGESTGVNLPAVLRAMNDRLEWLVGRDHLIGHAWFLKAKSREAVDEVMRSKVIPLIAEYFYDEWEKVRAVLGGTDAFVQGEKLEPPPDLDGGGEQRYRWTVRASFPEGAYEELIAGGKSLRQSRLLVREWREIRADEDGLTSEDINRLYVAAKAGGAPLEASGRCRPEAHRAGIGGSAGRRDPDRPWCSSRNPAQSRRRRRGRASGTGAYAGGGPGHQASPRRPRRHGHAGARSAGIARPTLRRASAGGRPARPSAALRPPRRGPGRAARLVECQAAVHRAADSPGPRCLSIRRTVRGHAAQPRVQGRRDTARRPHALVGEPPAPDGAACTAGQRRGLSVASAGAGRPGPHQCRVPRHSSPCRTVSDG